MIVEIGFAVGINWAILNNSIQDRRFITTEVPKSCEVPPVFSKTFNSKDHKIKCSNQIPNLFDNSRKSHRE